jgi:hypothetical protein
VPHPALKWSSCGSQRGWPAASWGWRHSPFARCGRCRPNYIRQADTRRSKQQANHHQQPSPKPIVYPSRLGRAGRLTFFGEKSVACLSRAQQARGEFDAHPDKRPAGTEMRGPYGSPGIGERGWRRSPFARTRPVPPPNPSATRHNIDRIDRFCFIFIDNGLISHKTLKTIVICYARTLL